jgi:serine/threonine protein kinase
MFLDEARLVANLVHPNIVQVYQLAHTRREVFIIMEHVFGRTLLDLVERLQQTRRTLPLDITAHLVARICHGLYYAHNKHSRTSRHLGIVHRDICPANILLSFRGIPKLTDFGVAKAITSKVDDEGNVIWGKYAYMAPEAVSRQGTDPRSDIYSLGLVMYEMLTGKLAHDVDSTRALTELLDTEPPPVRDPRHHAPNVPDALAEITIRATDPDPDRRQQSAKILATELEQFLLSHFMFPDEESTADFLASVFSQADRHRWW